MQQNQREWLIEDWYPIGHKVMDYNTEGGFKTMYGCWIAVCVASGNPVFGKSVKKGPVLMIDEETPEADLKRHLARFALGLEIDNLEDLPIHVMSMTRFRFGRKTELDRILGVVKDLQPVAIRIDSLLACLPGGRQGMEENNDKTGIIMRDDLNAILQVAPQCTILIAAHCKKAVAEWSLKELKSADIVTAVRGHGSIVGEACDTGISIKKISEYPDPTRFVVVTRPRRRAVLMAGEDVYVELEEQKYGQGPARLVRISPLVIPPSKISRALFPLFSEDESVTAQIINRKAAFHTRGENRMAVGELEERKVIIAPEPFSYRLNPDRRTEVDEKYLEALEGIVKPNKGASSGAEGSGTGHTHEKRQRVTRRRATKGRRGRSEKTQLRGVCVEN